LENKEEVMRAPICLTGVVVWALFASSAEAEIPNQTPENLFKAATHVVNGQVGRIYSSTETSGNFVFTHSVAAVSVESVDKGSGIADSPLIYVRFWHKRWIGQGNPPPDHYGHRGVPKTGDEVRVYLQAQADGGLDVARPNGFEAAKE
jgi:hypothetical protein